MASGSEAGSPPAVGRGASPISLPFGSIPGPDREWRVQLSPGARRCEDVPGAGAGDGCHRQAGLPGTRCYRAEMVTPGSDSHAAYHYRVCSSLPPGGLAKRAVGPDRVRPPDPPPRQPRNPGRVPPTAPRTPVKVRSPQMAWRNPALVERNGHTVEDLTAPAHPRTPKHQRWGRGSAATLGVPGVGGSGVVQPVAAGGDRSGARVHLAAPGQQGQGLHCDRLRIHEEVPA